MDQWSKTTSHEKRCSDTLQHGELRSYRGSRLCQRVRPPVLIIQLQGHLQARRVIVLHFLQARLLHLRHH